MEHILKYRQIDFLRLFRLCVNNGIIKRKRKIPTEYSSDRDVLTALKRLMRAFLKGTFIDYSIYNKRDNYLITVPRVIVDAFHFIERQNSEYFETLGEYGSKALRKYTEAKRSISGFVSYANTDIRVSVVSTQTTSDYRIAKSMGAKYRPPQEFYKCALAVQEFKNSWDECTSFLIEFYNKESQLIQERKEQIRKDMEERRAKERKRLAEVRQQEEEHKQLHIQQLEKLEKQAEEEHARRLANAQSLFNQALEQVQRS